MGQRKIDSETKPLLIERLALASVYLAAIAHSLTKIDMTDTPWHLATAREAFSSGSWPVVNTFSYTYPEAILYQQYPLYQSLLYTVYQAFSWTGLSFLHCFAWIVVLTLWILWSGGLSRAARYSLLWMLVVFGLQQRMALRPEILSVPLMIGMLLAIDRFRENKNFTPLFLLVVLQLLLANSHQMFTLGLYIQCAFVIHLIVARVLNGELGCSKIDLEVPILPPFVTCVCSFLVCLFTPLGKRIVEVPFVTLGSLSHHRPHVHELASIASRPYSLTLVLIAAAVVVVGLYRVRKNWQPFELAILFMGAMFISSAWRGIALFVAIAIAVFSRCIYRVSTSDKPQSSRLGVNRLATLSVTFALCFFVLHFRWVVPVRGLTGVQPGVGMSVAQWPNDTIDLLKTNPPPGKMLNIGWYTGNALIWNLYPDKKVFIDPRFEAYPREFLLENIEAISSKDKLEQLIETYQPDYIVGELRLDQLHKRSAELVATGKWQLLAVDPVFFILVKASPQTNAYLDSFANFSPQGIVEQPADLRKLQIQRLIKFFKTLGSDNIVYDLTEKLQEL